MIKSISKNELSWITLHELRERVTDEEALKLVNSKERKLIINGYTVISQDKNDLLYINDLFTSVRIKIGYVNTIKFYGIEYATNYNVLMFRNNNERLREQFEKRFIRFEDIILGNKTIEDLKEASNFIKVYHEKRSTRASNRRYIDNLVTIKKRAKETMKVKVLSKLQSFKDKYGNDVYLQDGVIYTRYQILSTHKCLM